MVVIISNKEKSGSVYYDKERKKWRCIYYIYDTNTLEEIRRTKSFDTEKEANDFRTSIQYQRGNDLFIKNNGILLNQLMRENAEQKLELNLIKARTYTRIMETIRQIEESPISKQNIMDITSNDITNYLNSLKDYSDSTIKKVTEQFSQAFNIAFNKGYITRNPMFDVRRPKSTKQKKEVKALEIEEQQKLTSYLMSIPGENEPYKVAYLIEMYLGLRIGKILALRSTDIDLHKNLISVNKTLTLDKDKKVVMGDTTKTYSGIREVPIPSFIKNEIINQMILAEDNRDKQLFLYTNGNYVRPNHVNYQLKNISRKLGLPDITTHCLRHTYGTRCIEAGILPVVTQRLMGHKNISVTLDTYTSIFNRFKLEELDKVNKYYMNNSIIQPLQPFLEENNNSISKEIVFLNKLNAITIKQQLISNNKDDSIIEKKKKIQELYSMVGNAVLKGTIPVAEYLENLECLQKIEQELNKEEKGEI